MDSFRVVAIGHLARNPELETKGGHSYTRFCLIGNDYAGRDEEGAAREIVTSVWFVAFGALGETIARSARKGDQLMLEGKIRASNWVDKQGEKQYDYSFIVDSFRYGAPGRLKRGEFDGARDEQASRDQQASRDVAAGAL